MAFEISIVCFIVKILGGGGGGGGGAYWKIIYLGDYLHKIINVAVKMTRVIHDDVIKWKHFPRYWPFVRGIHRSRRKASYAELWFFFDLRLNNRLSKQSWGWWFETLSGPLWRHCNDLFSILLMNYDNVTAVRSHKLFSKHVDNNFKGDVMKMRKTNGHSRC